MKCIFFSVCYTFFYFFLPLLIFCNIFSSELLAFILVPFIQNIFLKKFLLLLMFHFVGGERCGNVWGWVRRLFCCYFSVFLMSALWFGTLAPSELSLLLIFSDSFHLHWDWLTINSWCIYLF